MAVSERRLIEDGARAAEALVAELEADHRVRAQAITAWCATFRLTAVQLAIEELFRELRIPHAWAAPLLVKCFASKLVGASGKITITPDIRLDSSDGRKSKSDGRHVRRDVEWYYRNKIKSPADSIHEIAREYAAGTERTDARSVVQNGIKRAKTLLSIYDDGGA